MTPVSFLVLGAGDRGNSYAQYAKSFPDQMSITGIAEPDDERRNRFIEKYTIPPQNIFTSWEEALQREKMADAVIIATQDQMHYQPSLTALDKGYDILVEKPMATTLEECRGMVTAAKKYDKIFGVCHVLRYTDYYRTLKEMLDSKRIGDIATIEHIEGVQYFHQAHSFVRGNWRRKDESSPMILAKSCHDMDILRWFAERPCEKIASFGSLLHFKKENAPKGSTLRCIDGCAVEKDCPYSAIKIYLDPKITGWPVSTITQDISPEGRKKALTHGPYGRCVYHCDNDVVDHQVVICSFTGGVTASFTMSAFTARGAGRETRIMGTQGEIVGDSQHITIRNFSDDTSERIDIQASPESPADGHGGGDAGIMRDFIAAVRHQDKSYLPSSIEDSLESHVMAFCAEESRVNEKVLRLDAVGG